MTVFVDSARHPFRRMKMCHMIADSLDELHDMAARIGIRRKWFQSNASTPHYDICLAKRKLAIEYGAVELDRNQFVSVIRRLRATRNAT